MQFPLASIVGALERAGLLESVRGEIPASFESISDDSRQVAPGALFVAVQARRKVSAAELAFDA